MANVNGLPKKPSTLGTTVLVPFDGVAPFLTFLRSGQLGCSAALLFEEDGSGKGQRQPAPSQKIGNLLFS